MDVVITVSRNSWHYKLVTHRHSVVRNLLSTSYWHYDEPGDVCEYLWEASVSTFFILIDWVVGFGLLAGIFELANIFVTGEPLFSSYLSASSSIFSHVLATHILMFTVLVALLPIFACLIMIIHYLIKFILKTQDIANKNISVSESYCKFIEYE